MTSMREIIAVNNPQFATSLPPPVDDKFPPPNGREAPMSEMAASYLPQLQTVAKDPNKRILVVGCIVSNLGQKLAAHPRVLMWASQDESKWTRGEIPITVGAVLVLKWIGHSASSKLIRAARERGLVVTPVPLSTGDVRQLLNLVLFGAPQREPFATDHFGPRSVVSPIYSYASEGAPADLPLPPEVPAPAPPPTPAEPIEPDPLPTPSPAGPPPTEGASLRGLSELVLKVGGNPAALPHSVEARRIGSLVRQEMPSADDKRIATMLNQLHLKNGGQRRKFRGPWRSLHPASVEHTAPVPEIPASVTVAASPVIQEPEPVEPDVVEEEPAAGASIDEALTALAGAENAIHKAMDALIAARAQMAETIVKEVEAGVQAAIDAVAARFRR